MEGRKRSNGDDGKTKQEEQASTIISSTISTTARTAGFRVGDYCNSSCYTYLSSHTTCLTLRELDQMEECGVLVEVGDHGEEY